MLTAIIAVAVTSVLAVVMLLVLSAPPAIAPGNEGGPGLPVRVPSDVYSGEPVSLEGSLSVGSEGCFRLDAGAGELFVIWPEGYSSGGDAVIDLEGEVIVDGGPLAIEGLLMPYEALIAIEGPDGYWASVAGFCIRDDDAVLVAESVRATG